MNKSALKAAVAFVIFLAAIAAYFYWQNMQIIPAPKPTVTAPPVQQAPKLVEPIVQKAVEPPVVKQPLPLLAQSDKFILDSLAELIGNKSLMKLFHTDRVIRNLVVTIDSLPRSKLPLRMLPVEEASGKFLTSGSKGKLTISPKNSARYTPYVQIAEAIDPVKLVELYVRLYPLFQQAYQEVGFPNDYFNDRLIEVLDDLMDAPDVTEPVKLVQPKVFYLFADPELEELSIGQRILMRIGSDNEARLKVRLAAIKQALLPHMHDNKIGLAY